MLYTLEHEVPGRLRVRLDGTVPDADVEPLARAIRACSYVTSVSVYPRIGSVAVCYAALDDAQCEVAQTAAESFSTRDAAQLCKARDAAQLCKARDAVLEHLSSIDATAIEQARGASDTTLVPYTHSLLTDIAVLVGGHMLKRWVLPAPLSCLLAVVRYATFLRAAMRSLTACRLDVPVLDAAAIGMSFLQGDVATAGQTMFLLDLGETLEDYTRARSERELIYSLLDMPESAQLIRDGEEVSIPATDLREGDLVVVRTGMPISVDGVVERGIAQVNQANLTGEPLAVERTVGDDVFAGTAVEDGEIFIRVHADTGDTRLRSIVSLVEQSQACKARSLSRMENLADSIVPWNFLLAGVVALTTRSLTRTAAALMVDYSCALKLAGSIAVLSAMKQSASLGIAVKGSLHFESMAAADTIVFDKTGTLTESAPQVAAVLALDGWAEDEVLRLAACLEEHFPHPVARAVVRAAASRDLDHRERHAAVEYIVAHGIASSLDGKRVVIGSGHFVTEDEGVLVDESVRERIAEVMPALSPLFLAVDGCLVGVLGIEDPLKDGVAQAVEQLRAEGFKRIVMLTGDNERMAAKVAAEAGIDEIHANMLHDEE